MHLILTGIVTSTVPPYRPVWCLGLRPEELVGAAAVWLTFVAVAASLTGCRPADTHQRADTRATTTTTNPVLRKRVFELDRTLVVDVEVAQVDRALETAGTIVEPVKTQYDEILVYLHQWGVNPDAVSRRVQWTPAGGYRELVFATGR